MELKKLFFICSYGLVEHSFWYVLFERDLSTNHRGGIGGSGPRVEEDCGLASKLPSPALGSMWRLLRWQQDPAEKHCNQHFLGLSTCMGILLGQLLHKALPPYVHAPRSPPLCTELHALQQKQWYLQPYLSRAPLPVSQSYTTATGTAGTPSTGRDGYDYVRCCVCLSRVASLQPSRVLCGDVTEEGRSLCRVR
ncbi:unnamed protein product [Arctogadus glacialis]